MLQGSMMVHRFFLCGSKFANTWVLDGHAIAVMGPEASSFEYVDRLECLSGW